MQDNEINRYEKLAMLGNEEAIYLLSNHYQEKGNYIKAFSYLTRIVNTKNPTYLRKIGYFFEKGLGVDKNRETAFEYYLKSAELGDYISQFNVAICYFNGIGIDKNEEKAFVYGVKSANQKYEKALVFAANLLRTGCGCERDLDSAMKYLEKCGADNYDAIYVKSLILLNNYYSKFNIELGVRLLEKGAFANHINCTIMLADILHGGVFMGVDDSRSLSLLLKAAKNGSRIAMKKLSDYYVKGIGTTVNLDIAEFWKNEAEKKK